MKKRSVLAIILTAIAVLATLALAACGGGGDGGTNGKKVSKLEVVSPTKIEYKLGEQFTTEGGYLKVTYEDGSTADVKLDAEGVSFDKPNMDSLGKKTIEVKYGGKRVRFNITVNEQTYNVTLDMNYDGATAGNVEAIQNKVLEASKVPAPTRSGYDFDGWFTENTCTMPYDFNNTVTGEMTLYARWIKQGTQYSFTIDTNCTGLALKTYTQKYAQGEKAVKRAVDPEKGGFRFDGWCTTAECTTAYDFNTPLSADTTVYAKWTRTLKAGENEFVFEAENIDLSKMTGPGLSGTSQQGGMLGAVTNKGASGNRYLGFLGKNGATAAFVIDSDVAVESAKLVVRLSMEARNYTFNPSNYLIKVNGASVNYSDIVFTGVPGFTAEGAECVEFRDFEIGNVSLVAGSNTIELVTNNSDALTGTTVLAASPLIDCIKITSTSVLNWDGGKGLPMQW